MSAAGRSGGRAGRRARLAAGVGLSLVLAQPGCASMVAERNAGLRHLEEAPGPTGPVSLGAKYLGWVAGAPLSLAMAPLALLAWPTPWVDLFDAADLCFTPPALVGYVSQALLGYPTWGLFAWLEPEPDVPGPLSVPETTGVAWSMVIEHRELGARGPPRPAATAPLASDVSAYYRLPGADQAWLSGVWRRARSPEPWRVRLPGLQAWLEVTPADPAEHPGRRPLLLMTPPSEGNFAARYLARLFADEGVTVILLAPDEVAVRPGVSPGELETKLRDAVRWSRAAVELALELEPVDPDQVTYLGISAGGVFGAVLMGLEPVISRAALIFPGGDLPSLLRDSQEPNVTAFREHWASRGLPPAELERSLRAVIRTDPLRFAARVDPRRVLLFLAARDDQVPIANGLLLHEALGEPETWLLSGGHISGSLSGSFLLETCREFLFESER